MPSMSTSSSSTFLFFLWTCVCDLNSFLLLNHFPHSSHLSNGFNVLLHVFLQQVLIRLSYVTFVANKICCLAPQMLPLDVLLKIVFVLCWVFTRCALMQWKCVCHIDSDEICEAMHSQYRIFEEKHGYKNNNKNSDTHKKMQRKSMIHFNSLNLGDV